MSPTRAPYGEASRTLLRTTVLGAVDDLLRERAWPAVSMAAVAAGAGVSRQTLYNEFGSRDDLARAYVLWAADDFLDEVERTVTAHADDLRAALLAAFELFLAMAAEHPMVRAVVATAGADDLRTLVASPAGVPLVITASSRLAAIVGATWPTVAPATVDAAAELLVRLAISHLTVPTGTPAEAAAGLDAVVGPFLAQLVDPGH